MDGITSHAEGAFPGLRKPVVSTKSALVAQARERHSHDRKMEGFSKEHSNIMADLRREQKKLSKSLENLLTRKQAIKGNKGDSETRKYLSCEQNDTHILRGRLTKSLDTATTSIDNSRRRLTRQLSCRSESGSPLPSYVTRTQSSSDEEKDFLHPWIRSNSSPDTPSFTLRARKGLSGRDTISSASSGHGSFSSPEPSPPPSPRRTVPKQYRKLGRSASDTQAPSEHYRVHSEGAKSSSPPVSLPGSGRPKKVSSVPKLPEVQQPKSLSLPSSPQMIRHDVCLLAPKRHSFNAKKRMNKGKMFCDVDVGDCSEREFCSDGVCYRLPKQGRAKPKPRGGGRRQSVADGVPQIVTSLDTSRETDEFWYLRYVLEDSPTEV
ncbi:PREDICTED: uncharacterized protein LOC109483610 [Branchiostoma belcheri]|uniref:Uncharacterized protein LOC109483610 n=1 Tax=Branchiostoma belcheri TaxID=7741 RepID=A0A6P5AJN1_BRABE|nr:PREDICTED: uncharacterized protein LOC109483610 [Branchiostoma belcheri]